VIQDFTIIIDGDVYLTFLSNYKAILEFKFGVIFVKAGGYLCLMKKNLITHKNKIM
jgi:hypothetical protein